MNRKPFGVLESIQAYDKKTRGRPDINPGQILVLGVVRLSLDHNYDSLVR